MREAPESLEDGPAAGRARPSRGPDSFHTLREDLRVVIGFDRVGLDELAAYTLHDNVRSRRVMEKAGLTYERDIVHDGRPQVLYRIRKGSSNDG